MPTEEHRARKIEPVCCAVLTISDTRTAETDTSGPLIRKLLEDAGHRVVRQDILPDELDGVRRFVESQCDDDGCQCVLLTGGTGLSSRDSTVEAIEAILDKRIDGFGELFRSLSYEQIGAAAMFSRAVAGARRGTAVFAMPGSTDAVALAMEKLILPELGHIAWLVRQ